MILGLQERVFTKGFFWRTSVANFIPNKSNSIKSKIL